MRGRNRQVSGPRAPAPGSSVEHGFTLIEVMVSLALMVLVLGGLLGILQLNSRIAKAQVNVSEMQQALRVAQADVVRDVRSAGRGGLPPFRPPSSEDPPKYAGMPLPAGPAVAVTNNVTSADALSDDTSAKVVLGTDILTIRGVLHTTMYQVEYSHDGKVGTSGSGTITVRDMSPTGVPQDLDDLKAAIKEKRPEALLLVSSASDQIQAVVELTGGMDNNDGSVDLTFNTTGGTHTDKYLELSPDGTYPSTLTTVAAVGIVEEYRYYVRDVAPAPRLARARFYPGTDAPYAADANNLHVDVADNVLDFQVALGIDQNGDAVLADAGTKDDDWLFNATDDDPGDPDWNGAASSLYYLRISTLARTDRVDPDHTSVPIEAIEDHDYSEAATPAADDVLERGYRRRLLQTVVDLRNL